MCFLHVWNPWTIRGEHRSIMRDIHNHWSICFWLTLELMCTVGFLCFSISLYLQLLHCSKFALHRKRIPKSSQLQFAFDLIIFKVEENSRTFQGLAQKFKDFSRLCKPCNYALPSISSVAQECLLQQGYQISYDPCTSITNKLNYEFPTKSYFTAVHSTNVTYPCSRLNPSKSSVPFNTL